MIFSHSGASGHNSFQSLSSIHMFFSTSIFNKLHTMYRGIHECQADSDIEKLHTLLIVAQSGLIQSDHKNTLFISISFSYKLSTKNAAELSVTIVSGTQASTNSFEVFLHWYKGLVSEL
jgi:hypothetical protein